MLLTIECLRSDRVHSFGYMKDITPNLDKLIENGTSYNNAFATSTWTPASVTSFLTSTFPLAFCGRISLSMGRTSIAEVLKKAGYRTAAFNSGLVLSPIYGYGRGFETYVAGSTKKNMRRRIRNFLDKLKLNRGGTSLADLISSYKKYRNSKKSTRSEFLSLKALSWIKRVVSEKKNFFLWIHYPDTHEPYYIKSENAKITFREIFNINKKAMHEMRSRKAYELKLSEVEISLLKSLFDESIKLVDEQIGFFIRELEKLGILKDTYIAVTADHGQQFLEHGDFGHGLYLYDEIIRVPLVILGPGIPKMAYHQPVSLIDLAPTFLDLLGVQKPHNFWGSNLLKNRREFVVIEEARNIRKDVKMEEGKILLNNKFKKIALRNDFYKYIYDIDKEEEELYDILNDPSETKNISKNNPKLCEDMNQIVFKHIEFEDTWCDLICKIDDVSTYLQNESKNKKLFAG